MSERISAASVSAWWSRSAAGRVPGVAITAFAQVHVAHVADAAPGRPRTAAQGAQPPQLVCHGEGAVSTRRCRPQLLVAPQPLRMLHAEALVTPAPSASRRMRRAKSRSIHDRAVRQEMGHQRCRCAVRRLRQVAHRGRAPLQQVL